MASAPRARGRSTGAEGVCERRPFLLMKATSMLFSIPDMLTPSAAWLVGAGTLLLHAQLKKRRNRVSSGQSTASSQAKLAKTIGSGRRSRFQDSQIPPLFCVPDARAYESATEKINLSVETSTVLEVGCQLNRVTHSLAARAKALIGVDINRKAPRSQRQEKGQTFYRQPGAPVPANASLHILDTWDLAALAEVMCGGVAAPTSNEVSVVFFDASVVLGNDLPFEILALTRSVMRLCPNLQCIVVKSRALCALQQQLRPVPCPTRPLARASAYSSASSPRALAPAPATAPVPVSGRVHLLAADLVHDYRTAAHECVEHLLAPGEWALEIGAHVGATTVLIHDLLCARGGGGCVGVDVSESIIARAKVLNPHVPFDVADAWDVRSLLAALEHATTGTADGAETSVAAAPPPPSPPAKRAVTRRAPALLLVDVGGLSGANGTLDAVALIRMLCAVFHSSLRALVIKSSCLRTLARQLKTVRDLDRIEAPSTAS